MNDEVSIYKIELNGESIKQMTWKDLKNENITIDKRDEPGKTEVITVMDKDAFDNSPFCASLHLNDAQKELIDDLRSVQEKQLETQWIDRDHKALRASKPEEYGDPEPRYCCCNISDMNKPHKLIEANVFDAAAIYEIDPFGETVNDETPIVDESGKVATKMWK